MCAWLTWTSAQFFSHILHTAFFIHCRKRTRDAHAHTHTHATSNSLPITVRLNASDRASPLQCFVFLRRNESGASTPCAPPDVLICLKYRKNSQAHGNAHARARTDKLSAAHPRARSPSPTRARTYTNFKPSGASRFISDCSLLSFQPISPLPPLSRLCVCLSFFSLDAVSSVARSAPPHPFASRWGKDNSPDTCIKLYTILWHGTGGHFRGRQRGGGTALRHGSS